MEGVMMMKKAFVLLVALVIVFAFAMQISVPSDVAACGGSGWYGGWHGGGWHGGGWHWHSGWGVLPWGWFYY
jgi:hypothetical protein